MNRKFLLLGLLLLLSAKTFSQNEMFKALFMYSFTKYIQWPESYKTGDFIITVIGNEEMYNEMQKIASTKKVNNQHIQVYLVDYVSQVRKSHIVYLASSKSSQLPSLISALDNTPTAIITDKEGLCKQGAGINYVIRNGKQKFEINQKKLEEKSLTISEQFLLLGLRVN